jgi:hypothetical protein
MRSCPTLGNNITNIYKTELTMTEVAPYATDHDDDSKRIVSSYSYDLLNQDKEDDDSITMIFKNWEEDHGEDDDDDQEPNQDDNNVSFVPPDILTAVDALTMFFNEWEDEMTTNFDDCYNISVKAPSHLNFTNGLIRTPLLLTH